MLDKDILEQVKSLFSGLKSHYVLRATVSSGHEKADELSSFLADFCSTSPMLELEKVQEDGGRLEFSIVKDGADTGITFRGIPGGHEFTSLLLAILNADGKGKNLPDAAIAARLAQAVTDCQAALAGVALKESPEILPYREAFRSQRIFCTFTRPEQRRFPR